MKKVFIGIDNGVSGSIGIISPEGTFFFKTPTFSEQDYVKKKANITRIEINELYIELKKMTDGYKPEQIQVALERPMVNPTRFKASISAVRALEATLTVIESLEFPYQFEDSKAWQKMLLPSGIKGTPELKKASLDIGNRLFPQHSENEHKDRDGMLIAEYLRRINKH